MGFLRKLNKKKPAAPAEAAEATVETTSMQKAPTILVEDVPADEEEEETAAIERQDSKKSVDPDGIKSMESRDPEEVQPAASNNNGSKPDAPASRPTVSVATEPRDPEGAEPPNDIVTPTAAPVETEAEDLPMSPPETPRAFPSTPKNAATDFLDAIGKTLSNVCMLGGGVRPMDDEFEEDDDDSSRASGVTSSTLGQESVAEGAEATAKEDANAADTAPEDSKELALGDKEDAVDAKEREMPKDLLSLADEDGTTEDEEKVDVEEVADMENTENAGPVDVDTVFEDVTTVKAKKGLFGWCAGCRSAKSTTAAIAGTTAVAGVTAGAAAVVAVAATVDEEPVAIPDFEPTATEVATETNETAMDEMALDVIPEQEEESEEVEQVDIVPAVGSALSDQGSKRSKRSRANSILAAAMSRFQKKKALPDEVALNNDLNNLEEIPGMVRFMSHTERIERGFEVLLRDFSGFMRQCGQCEIQSYEYDTAAAADVLADDLDESANVTQEVKVEETVVITEEPVKEEPAQEETAERKDSEERQVEEEVAEGRDDELQPEEPVATEEIETDLPTVASKQSKSSRFSLRSILGKKNNSILVIGQSSNVPDEVAPDVTTVPSKALSNLSHASAGRSEDEDEEMGPAEAAQATYQVDNIIHPPALRTVAAE